MRDGQIKYQAAAGTDVVVSAKPALLHRIIIGKDVASAVVEVSNSPDDGDGDVQLKLEGDTLHTTTKGALEVGAVFNKGIAADITNQTEVTFVFSNLGAN